MKSKNLLLKYLTNNGATTVDTLAIKLKFSRQYIHKLLDSLLTEESIEKIGSAPHVYYNIKLKNAVEDKQEHVAPDVAEFLQKHFIIIDALGNLLYGINALSYWCRQQNLPLKKTTLEYLETRTKYLNYYNNGVIDGLQKLKNTNGIGKIGVDEFYYLDFYAIERFGKTRLGTLMHFAKQGQNKQLMKQVVAEIKNSILYFVEQNNVDAIVYVPPTIKRTVQIMSFLEKNLKIDLPKVLVKKINNPIVIPQKALAKLFERVANANKTFVVPEQTKYKHILILDDAIGSGATINEIALKLKAKKLAQKVTGLAITGSVKGFEVISEL
jgi:phosphoribosylpyrophosphate synthetase